MLFTFRVTELRIRFRREMNDADNEAASKTVDALLNYETVKYFGNDSHEAGRYDRALASYQEAAVRSRTSLSFLKRMRGLINRGRESVVELPAPVPIHVLYFTVFVDDDGRPHFLPDLYQRDAPVLAGLDGELPPT